MKRCRYIVFLLLAGMVGQGCSSRALHEAEAVVTEADSLWHEGKQYGIDEGDSATLAQAYETLGAYQFLSPFAFHPSSSFTHACYHYGKLLRARDHPAEAMQAFINATHSRTRDYRILGRVYSNMGSICHLAGDFPLSYDMYEKSANIFLQNGDTLAYYYGLNDMAYELAEQGQKDSCFNIIANIKNHASYDSVLLAYCWITQAQACLKCKQYDSLIFYAQQSKQIASTLPSSSLQLAQAYSYLGERDSATYYALFVLNNTNELFDVNNALYILTNDDMSKDKDAIRETAAARSDTQKIEKRKSKLSQSILLLEQDLARKPDLKWLYTVIAVVLFICSAIILVHVWRKRKQHQQIIHEIDIKQHQQAQLIEGIATLHTEISQLSEQQQKTHLQLLSDIEATCSALRNTKDLHKEPYWKDYGQLCEMINRRFNNLAFLLQKYSLSEREVRLCVLVLLDLNRQQIAEILPYSLNGIGKFKYRVAQKLGTNGGNLRNFLIKISIDSTN